MKKLLLIGVALGIQGAAFGQLVNTDFENWINPVNGNVGSNRPVGWLRTNGIPGSESQNFYHAPATNAQNGNYALRLSVWYTYDMDMAKQTAPINSRPAALTGFFTYTNNQIDSPLDNAVIDDVASATVTLTKINQQTGLAEVIGMGQISFPASFSYSPFSVPINYTSTETPDTIEVLFDCSLMEKSNGGSGHTAPHGDGGGVCSILTIDNIALSAESLGQDQINEVKLKVYPNPATSIIAIDNYVGDAKIFDLTGKLVTEYKSVVDQIDVSNISTGIYILSLKNSTYNTKLIKL